MTERLVVVGGDAAGMSAASQARRRRSDLEIIAFERSSYVSYSACGEPYYVAGYVEPLERLVARQPEDFAERDIEVKLRHEVTGVDLDQRWVEVRNEDSGQTNRVSFDQLMMATGSKPLRPATITGLELPGVYALRTLEDAAALRSRADAKPRRVVVIGAGYIGLEVAEAFHHRGSEVIIVSSGPQVLERTLDSRIGALFSEGIRKTGITLHTGTWVRCINGTDRVESVGCEGDLEIPTDLVVIGLGTAPDVDLARAAGIELGETGAIAVDNRQRTRTEGVWSAGDCAEAPHRITGRPTNFHLGTIANKTGRVAGINIGGDDAVFPGVLGTAITRVYDIEAARTGLGPEEAAMAGFDPQVAIAEGTTTAGYWPDAATMTIMAIADKKTGRLLGAQIVGGPGSAKRIDVFATAIWQGMTAGDLAWTDLAYAPPFSGVWDLIHIAARKAAGG